MYVKKILLRNFKSFPKATVELDKNFSGVVGPNGSGKCVRADTKVLLSDGSLVEIRRLVDEALERESSPMDDGYCSLSNNGTRVLSLNTETLKMEEKPVTAFVKRASPDELYELKTSSGRKVVATSYHPVLTVVDGEVKAINAGQLKEGSWVALPRRISIRPSNTSPLLELARLDLNLYVLHGADFVVLLRKHKQSKKLTWSEFALKAGVPLVCLKGLLEGQAVKLNHAYKLAKFMGKSDYEFTSVFNQVKAKNHNILTRIPAEVSPDLARFLGLVISEGRPVKNEVFFFNSSKTLLDDFVGLSERLFGIRPSLKSYDGKQVVIFSSAALSLMLEHVFGVKPYSHSSRKAVPDAVMSSSDDVVAAFIGGLFDGDGTVSDPLGSKATLEYTSASRELVDRLNYLLLRFGITSRVSSSFKAATNTKNKTKREYYRLFVYGVDLLKVFGERVPLLEPPKVTRLSVWSKKTNIPNKNVDVVPGLNTRIKSLLAAAGYSDRKLKSVKPSRIRAYYENRCLPSREGLVQVTRLVQDASLEAFASSDVFWDTIVSVEKVPGEEWVYDLTVEGNHNFVAEGLFVHNSNIIDALMFAFGEMRLKSLRVKSTKDLIFKSHNVADVSVILTEDDVTDFAITETEEKGKTKKIFPRGVHEVRKMIRRDGKTKYSLDGRRVKKYVIEDFLSQHSISLHHAIKQGEVQRIVEMNSKDRRALIDFVSNVSEYEEKKKEAFVELGTVDMKLKEAQTVFAERDAYLKELEEDKKNAERFMQMEKVARSASATLLHLDIGLLGKQMEELVAKGMDNKSKFDELSAKLKECERRIEEAYAKKDELNRTISEKSQGKELALQREVDALQAKITQARALIEDRKAFVKKHDERRRAVELDKRKVGDEIGAYARQKASLEADLAEIREMLEKEQEFLDKLMGRADSFSKKFMDSRKVMEETTEEMAKCKDALGGLQAEVAKQQELVKIKEDEQERLKKGVFTDFSKQLAPLGEQKEAIGKEISPVDRQLRDLFDEEKQLNQRMPALEDILLDLREKMTACEAKLRAFSDSSSRALESVLSLREKEEGIYGTVGELVRYSSKYSVPIGVAIGNRLHYVVVDSVKTAGKAIDFLNSNGLGRVSFIPLDRISCPPADAKLSKSDGAIDYVVDLLKFEAKYKKAIEFACGNTLLMDDFSSAKSLVGKTRMVTERGDLFEQSGLVTGGKAKEKVDVFAENARLKEFEERFKKAKNEKDAVLKRLYVLRDEMSAGRRKKAELEVKLKRLELEEEHLVAEDKAMKEKQKDLHAAIQALGRENRECRTAVESADGQRSELIRKLSALNVKYLEAKQNVDVEKEARFGSMVKEKEHKVSELRISVVKLENEVRAAETQRAAYARQLAAIEKDAGMLLKDVEDAEKAIEAADVEIRQDQKVLKEKSEEQKALSKELKAWIEQREALDKEVSSCSSDKAKVQLALDKLGSVKQDAELKRVAVETRLADVKAQYAEYEGVELLKGKSDKQELLLLKRETEEELKKVGGQINLRAVETYDQKKGELEKQRVRVDQLIREKDAVMVLIQEIEKKKTATFMETFNTINHAFKKLFKTIFHGDGTLFLENAENPFEGGLTIQVQLENKEIKYLELMSGGEKALIALLFLFAIQSHNPSSIYILDEADAALDQENSRKLAMLLKQLSKQSQFLVVSHNEMLYKHADSLVGVAMGKDGSQLVGVKLSEVSG
ncbi:AAA family ATPase [Candidatus Micrarchaeota archaeon]|nr:AAA family ATPase [Candidatus Micrarchaeota archaeon]